MKKAITTESTSEDMLPEYRFDYKKAKPNRFSAANRERTVTVVLDEDVAKVFTTPEAVNKALRAFIQAMPQAAERENR